ncbi:MAG: hypothetical protein U0521_05625 [Anaerolineae bacterium]
MPEVNDLDDRIGILIYGQSQIIYSTQEFPTRNALVKLPNDEQIALVCDRYKLWMLNIAEELTQNPNAAYAILALLNSYFDMIASLSGYANKYPKERVKIGLALVFKELAAQSHIVDLLEDRLRNPMAHMGMTKDHIILIDEYNEPVVWGKYHGIDAIVINARLWVKHIAQHFEEFSANLRDPAPQFDQLRSHFLKRISEPA